MIPYQIFNTTNYPQDGNYQVCIIDLPFNITKNEDSNIIDEPSSKDKWVVRLGGSPTQSLRKVFEVRVSEDLEYILRYCTKLYHKSLWMEIERLLDEAHKYSKP